MSESSGLIRCGGCGAPVHPDADRCKYCRAPRVPSSPDQLVTLSPEQLSSLAACVAARLASRTEDAADHVAEGVCFLQLGQYDFARTALETAVRLDPRRPETYAFLAVAVLGGRHPRTLGLGSAREITKLATTARTLSPHEPYATAVLALVVREYFERGGVRFDGPSADSLCRELAPVLTPEIRAALRPHVRTSDELLVRTLLNQDRR